VVLIDHSDFAPAAAASSRMRYLWKKLRDWILKIRFSTERDCGDKKRNPDNPGQDLLSPGKEGEYETLVPGVTSGYVPAPSGKRRERGESSECIHIGHGFVTISVSFEDIRKTTGKIRPKRAPFSAARAGRTRFIR